MKTISIQEAIDLIKSTNGQIFGVTFEKRTTGEIRPMNCRLGVKKGVKGEGLKFDPFKKGLIPVFDMSIAAHSEDEKAFRFINLDGLKTLNINHENYKIA